LVAARVGQSGNERVLINCDHYRKCGPAANNKVENRLKWRWLDGSSLGTAFAAGGGAVDVVAWPLGRKLRKRGKRGEKAAVDGFSRASGRWRYPKANRERRYMGCDQESYDIRGLCTKSLHRDISAGFFGLLEP
jgi:hypothetical protein